MMGILVIWMAAFFMNAALLGIVVYQLICLSDLEFDYVNPFDSSSRINYFVIPEFALQATLTIFFLMTGRWVMFLLNVPVVYYHVKLYINNKYLVDVTEIFNHLNAEKRQRLLKLLFYIVLFFIIIYRFVVASVLHIIETDALSDDGFLLTADA